MRRIYKLLIGLIVLLGVYFFSPYFFGRVAQQYATRMLANQNNTLGKVAGIQVDLEQYDRGWFKSTALLVVRRINAEGVMQVRKTIPIVIHHGPSYFFNGRFYTGFAMITSSPFIIHPELPYEMSFRENIGFSGERGTFVVLYDKPQNPTAANIRIGSIVLHAKSDLAADRFGLVLSARNIRYINPEKTIQGTAGDFISSLNASYLGERHWKLNFGFSSGNDMVTLTMPGATTPTASVKADLIALNNLHFDTQQIATILKELIQIKQASENQQAIKPETWIALFQQMLTQMIEQDTWIAFQNGVISTPVGVINVNYQASFPTLPDPHDYFDIATRNVSNLTVMTPALTYQDPKTNLEYGLKDFTFNENNNTVFARQSQMSFGLFDVRHQQSSAATGIPSTIAAPNPTSSTSASVLYANGFNYTDQLYGDTIDLSQKMNWDLAKICFAQDCFDQMHGQLHLMHMNYDAFKLIANAMQKVMQYKPSQGKSPEQSWADLANAYAKLISTRTHFTFLHDMQTPNGAVKIHGEMMWPALKLDETPAASLFDSVMNQSTYEMHMLFPAIYVDQFLSQNAPEKTTSVAHTQKPSFQAQCASFLRYALAQGYLKKVGTDYVVDLTGKGSVVTINGVAWKMQP